MAIKNKKYVHVFKYAAYGILLLFFYVAQTTPRLFEISGVKPVWVVPLAIAIAMHEGEFAGGVFGALTGLLCDLGGHLLFGFNGLICCAACIAVGLLIIYLMQCNVAGCILFVFITSMIRGSAGYLFSYGIWNYESVWKIYAYQTIPTVVYTTAVSAPVYYLIRAVHQYFQKALKP